MKDIEGFALYLETAGPGVEAKRMREQVGEVIVEAVRATWSGRLLSIHTTPKEVEATLGFPDTWEDFIMGYSLPTRPSYFYTFEFDPEHMRLQECGFRRVGSPPTPPSITADSSGWRQYSLRLAELGATASEVRSWLGKPMECYGWWPIEIWQYPNGLHINLRHGVVESDDTDDEH